MASFVESATLVIKDESTANINKINAALKQLFATARSFKGAKINIDIGERGIARAATDIRRLTADLRSLQGAARGVNVNVNTSGISRAAQQLAQLRAQAARPINIATRAGAGPPRPPGAVPLIPRGGAPGGGAAGGGVLGSTYGSFMAVNFAVQAAAAALRSVATNAASRDRAALQASVAASQAQRDIFKEAGV